MSEEYLGLNISAQGLEKFEEKERYIDVTSVPTYKDFPDFNKKDVMVKKVTMEVSLPDGSSGTYVPNKMSADFIANAVGTKFDNWKGKRLFYTINKTMVGNAIMVNKVEEISQSPDKNSTE